MIGEFRTVSKDGKKKSFMTLTTSGLADLLRNIEFYCASENINVDVVHDELHGYRDSFNELESIFLRDQVPRVASIGNVTFLSNYPHIKSLEMASSKNDLMVQIADILCGFISNTFQLIDERKPLNAYTRHVLSSITKELNCKNKNLWTFNFYAPYDEIEQKIYSAIVPQNKIIKTDSKIAKTNFIEIINQEFPGALKGNSFAEFI